MYTLLLQYLNRLILPRITSQTIIDNYYKLLGGGNH